MSNIADDCDAGGVLAAAGRVDRPAAGSADAAAAIGATAGVASPAGGRNASSTADAAIPADELERLSAAANARSTHRHFDRVSTFPQHCIQSHLFCYISYFCDKSILAFASS